MRAGTRGKTGGAAKYITSQNKFFSAQVMRDSGRVMIAVKKNGQWLRHALCQSVEGESRYEIKTNYYDHKAALDDQRRSTRAEQKVKYIGLSGVPKPLFGLARLERTHEQKRVFVTEGPFDALTLMLWDLPAVCLLGSYLKKDLLRALEQFERVYVVTDFDAAGRIAARVIACQLGARAAIVPNDPSLQGKDANELAQHYRDAAARFAQLVARADAQVEQSAALQDVMQRLRNQMASTPERQDILQVLVEKLADVIAAEVARGHTVVLWSRAYTERGQVKTLPVGRHVMREVGTLHGATLKYSARREVRADAEVDVVVAEHGEVLEEAA